MTRPPRLPVRERAAELAERRRVQRFVLALLRHAPRRQVARVVGVSVSAIDKWASGAKRPSERHLERLRDCYPDVFSASDRWD